MSELDEELDEERVAKLSNKIMQAIRDNYIEGPNSRDRVYEALNALASCSALIIRGADKDEALEWFSLALNTNLKPRDDKKG